MMRLMVASVLTASTLLMACGGLEHVTEDELGASPSATLSFSGVGFSTGSPGYWLKLSGMRTSGPVCSAVGAVGQTLSTLVSPLVNCVSLTITGTTPPYTAAPTAGVSVCPGSWTFSAANLYDAALCGGTAIATCTASAMAIGSGSTTVPLNCTTSASTVSFDPSLS